MFTATTTYKVFSQNRLGRFLSPDPYGQFYSAYTGMGNNPVNLVDPSGGIARGWRIHTSEWKSGDMPSIGEPNWYLKHFDIFIFIDFGQGPTGGSSGGGNGGSTGPGCGSGGGSGSPNSDSHLSGPPPGPDGEEEETKTVPRGEPNEYKTEALSPAIPIGYQVLKITFATSAALVGTVAVLVVLTSSDTRPPEPLSEPDVVDAVTAVIFIEITEAVLDNVLNPELEGTTTSRGKPKEYFLDAESRRLQNDRYYPLGSKPPKWFWPMIGLGSIYELIKAWPKPDVPEEEEPVYDNTEIGPSQPKPNFPSN